MADAEHATFVATVTIGVNVGYAMRRDEALANIKAFEKVLGRPDYIVDQGAQQALREAVW